jgi:hypothetical protein
VKGRNELLKNGIFYHDNKTGSVEVIGGVIGEVFATMVQQLISFILHELDQVNQIPVELATSDDIKSAEDLLYWWVGNLNVLKYIERQLQKEWGEHAAAA